MEISSNALKALIATIRASTASLVEAAVTPIKAIPLEPGSEIRGEVLEKQPNGRYLVRVGTEVFDMALPRNTPTGKSLQMTYIGDNPRITFSIPQSGAKGSEVTLSGASRWLGSMTSNPMQTTNADGPTAARTAKLFDTLPVDRGAIVQGLRNAVTRSGLFYESHLVRWAENSFPLQELLKEPQGQRSPLMLQENASASPKTPQPPPSAEPPKPQTPALQAGRDATAKVQADLSLNRKNPFLSSEPGVLELTGPLSRESSITSGAKSPLLPFEPPDPQSLPIIKQQLELLQSGQFVWHGEPWQGQQLEWMIRREGKRKQQKSDNGWETSLKLDLPALGPLSAKVHLSGGEVRITIVASNENSVAKMEFGRKKLQDGMESAGLHLVGMEVRHEAP